MPTRTGSGRRRRTQRPGSDRGGVDIIATMPLTAQGRPWGIGRIFLLLRSGQVQPERPRGADPGVTPWFHALGQKRVVRSGVAQVLVSTAAVTQIVLLSQRKCLFFSSLSCGGDGIRSTPGVEIGSSRWIPRFGSPRGEIKGVLGTLNSEVVCRGVQVRRKDEVCRRGARSGRCRSGRRTAVRGHGVHVAERDHSRRARVGARPWSWSSAGGSPDVLAKAGVALVVLKEDIRVGGKHDIPTKVMATTLVALSAEVERDLISERTREGLARSRASGRKLGRPKRSPGVSRLDGKEDESRRFLQRDVGAGALARIRRAGRHQLFGRHGATPQGQPAVPPSTSVRTSRPGGNHAPARCRGVTVRGQRRLAARPVRPQDARRRVSETFIDSPPRSCAGNGTR